jgi:hypothetical protein
MHATRAALNPSVIDFAFLYVLYVLCAFALRFSVPESIFSQPTMLGEKAA